MSEVPGHKEVGIGLTATATPIPTQDARAMARLDAVLGRRDGFRLRIADETSTPTR